MLAFVLLTYRPLPRADRPAPLLPAPRVFSSHPRLRFGARHAGGDRRAEAELHHAGVLRALSRPDPPRIERDRHHLDAQGAIETGKARAQRRTLAGHDARAFGEDDNRAPPGERRLRLAHHPAQPRTGRFARSEEHTSELQSLMRISYAVFCLQNKQTT